MLSKVGAALRETVVVTAMLELLAKWLLQQTVDIL